MRQNMLGRLLLVILLLGRSTLKFDSTCESIRSMMIRFFNFWHYKGNVIINKIFNLYNLTSIGNSRSRSLIQKSYLLNHRIKLLCITIIHTIKYE